MVCLGRMQWPEGETQPVLRAPNPLPTYPARTLPFLSPQLTGNEGERSPSFLLPQLSIPSCPPALAPEGATAKWEGGRIAPQHWWDWLGLWQVVPRAVCGGDGALSEVLDECGSREWMGRY